MSTESDLKNMLAHQGPTLRSVDLSRVLRRSSRRRIAQQVAVGSATTLAVAGIGFAGFSAIGGFTGISGFGQSTTGDSSSLGGTATDGASKRAPADKVNLCGGTLAGVAPNASGLVLTTRFDPADASADRVSGTVTLTNSGPDRVTGTSAAMPAITLSKDRIVLWHSNGSMAAMGVAVDLAPGASMTYQASFQPVTCAVEDDSTVSFRDNLPHVAGGAYQVSAALDLSQQSPEGSFLSTELVTGPVSAVTLR
jgi:hypothetical protein